MFQVDEELAFLHGRLQKQPGQLGGLLEAARQIEALNGALQQWANEPGNGPPGKPWLGCVRVANLRGDTLVLFADSASALVPLRYRREALLAYFRARCGLNVTRIEAKVRPALDRGGVQSNQDPSPRASRPTGRGDG